MRTKGDLLKEAAELGIEIPDPSKASKFEIEDLLAAAKRPEGADWLPQIEPMAAHDFRKYSEEERATILADPNWSAEEKLDGVRMKVHVTPDGLRLDGRKKSDKTYMYSERTKNFPHLANCKVLSGKFAGMVLDSEIRMSVESIDTGSVITSGTLNSTSAVTVCESSKSIALQETYGLMKCLVFDLIRKPGGLRIGDASFVTRRKFLESLFERYGAELNRNEIYLVPSHTDKVGLFSTISTAGGEGVMLKHAACLYREGKRVREMLKWKKIETEEGFVSGYVPAEAGKGWEGLVGALEVSAFDGHGNARVIAAVAPGTLEFRKAITAADGSLKPEFYDRVLEVEGTEWTKTKRLFHATLLRWRPDKDKADCVVDFDSIHPGKNSRL